MWISVKLCMTSFTTARIKDQVNGKIRIIEVI